MKKTNKKDLNPAFQFYPGDWLRDVNLRLCSLPARGLWIDLLCIMFSSSSRGFAKANGRNLQANDLAKVVANDEQTISTLLQELEDNGVLSKDSDGCIYNRRMVRDSEISKARAKAGSKGGSAIKAKASHKQVTAPAVSASSSTSASTTKRAVLTHEQMITFEGWYVEYPKKKNRGDAEKAWKTLNPDVNLFQEMVTAVKAQKQQHDWKKEKGRYIPYPATWLRNKGWEDDLGPTGESSDKVSTFTESVVSRPRERLNNEED